MELDIKAPWIDGKVRCQNGYVYIDKPYPYFPEVFRLKHHFLAHLPYFPEEFRLKEFLWKVRLSSVNLAGSSHLLLQVSLFSTSAKKNEKYLLRTIIIKNENK